LAYFIDVGLVRTAGPACIVHLLHVYWALAYIGIGVEYQGFGTICLRNACFVDEESIRGAISDCRTGVHDLNAFSLEVYGSLWANLID
jgi:hypothetical protein